MLASAVVGNMKSQLPCPAERESKTRNMTMDLEVRLGEPWNYNSMCQLTRRLNHLFSADDETMPQRILPLNFLMFQVINCDYSSIRRDVRGGDALFSVVVEVSTTIKFGHQGETIRFVVHRLSVEILDCLGCWQIYIRADETRTSKGGAKNNSDFGNHRNSRNRYYMCVVSAEYNPGNGSSVHTRVGGIGNVVLYQDYVLGKANTDTPRGYW